MKLIVGLGNIGKEYSKTRHNIGFIIVDAVLNNFNFPAFKEDKKLKSEISTGIINGEKIILSKPTTFMNLSGLAVKEISTFYKIKPSDIFIIQDDKDMDFLKIRFKNEVSGDGGHNGIKSIIKELSKKDLNRFKIGVSNELLEKMPTDKFVLSNFSKEELKAIKNNEETIINQLLEKIKNG